MIRSEVKSMGKECRLYEKLENNAVRCLNCFHHCILNEGPPSTPNPDEQDPRASIGICCIRHNWKGKLYLIDHSRPGSIAVDPIEKTPLYHFFPGADIFTIGTVGCNFRCSYCQNWGISQAPRIKLKKRKNGYLKDIEESMTPHYSLTPEEAVERCKKRNIRFIEYNYNEPTIWIDQYVYETAKLAKENGMYNTLCTNGYQSLECIELIHKYMDAVNIDLKGPQKFYSKLCGARVKVVLRNIALWWELGVWVEITTLVIPEENDAIEDLKYLANEIFKIDPNIPWHLSRYHRDYKFAQEGSHESQTPIKTLLTAYKIAKEAGLKYVYLGNYWNRKYHSTICSSCNEVLVDRGEWGHSGKCIGFSTKEVSSMHDEEEEENGGNVLSATCKKCGSEVPPGIWSDKVRVGMPKRKEKIPSVYYERKFRQVLVDEDEKCVKILFASQTGVSEQFAHDLKEKGVAYFSNNLNSNRKVKICLIDLEEYDETKLGDEEFVVIVTSTHFFGRIPRNGERFYDYLCDNRRQRDWLKGLRYVVFGIGSTGDKKCHQETYQVVARKIDGRMEELGATRAMERVEANKKSWFRNTLKEGSEKLWKELDKLVV